MTFLFLLLFVCNNFFSLHAAQPESTCDADVQAVVTEHASPEAIKALYKEHNLDAIVAQYTDPVFIDSVVHAEEYRKQDYISWYKKPLLEFKHSTIALQNGDLVFAGCVGAGWGVEWFIFKQINSLLIEEYTKQFLLEKRFDEAFYAYKQKNMLQHIIGLCAAWTVISMGFSGFTKKICFDNWIDLADQKTSIVHSLSSPTGRRSLLTLTNPQTWFDVPNSCLEYLGMAPTWQKTTSAEFVKLFAINMATIIWYERSFIRPAWLSFCATSLPIHFDTELNKDQIEATTKLAITNALTLPFSEWLENKIIISGVLHTSINGLLLLWGAGKTYLTIKPTLEGQPCS
jgi:hypothetical protein